LALAGKWASTPLPLDAARQRTAGKNAADSIAAPSPGA